MKENSKRIELEEGIGQIKFGISRNQLKQIAGEPTEVEAYDHEDIDDKKAEAWHYDDAGLSIAFEEFNDWKLTSIAVSSPEYTLRGNAMVGSTYTDVLSLLNKFKLGEIVEEDMGSENSVEMKLISIDVVGLNLWFENEELSEIQLSQVWAEEE